MNREAKNFPSATTKRLNQDTAGLRLLILTSNVRNKMVEEKKGLTMSSVKSVVLVYRTFISQNLQRDRCSVPMYPVPCNLTKSYYPVCCCLQAPLPFYPRDRNEYKNGRALHLLLELRYMLQRKVHNYVQEIMSSTAYNGCCKCQCIKKFPFHLVFSYILPPVSLCIYHLCTNQHIYLYIDVSIYLNVCLQYSVDGPWQILQ